MASHRKPNSEICTGNPGTGGFPQWRYSGGMMDAKTMARALDWARDELNPCSPDERGFMAAIEEAFAAYDPNCGARTASVQWVSDDNGDSWRKQAGVTEAMVGAGLDALLRNIGTEAHIALSKAGYIKQNYAMRAALLAAIGAEGQPDPQEGR